MRKSSPLGGGDWKEAILRESRETLAALQSESENHPDIADRASSETDRAIELRARDRQRKLIAKIDAALALPDLFKRDPKQATQLSKARISAAEALQKAEEEWLEASSEFDEA